MIVDGKRIGLSPEQVAERRHSIGGSDANIIMKGGEDVYNLWLVKTGQKEPDSLDDILAVWMGTWTEALNAAWFTHKTSRPVTCRNVRVSRDELSMHTNLDGLTDNETRVFEAKHVGGFEPRETILSRYWPQLHHNGYVCRLNESVLSVFEGNSKWWYQDVDLDPHYMEELLEREREFWACVQSRTWTGDWKPVEVVVPTEFREVDMTGSNLWADQAMQWLQSRPAKQAFDKAEKELKGMVAVDVSRAHGHGVEVKRDRSNKLRIGTIDGPAVD